MTQVFVVDRAACFGGRWPQGFVPLAGDAATRFLADAHALGRFVERPLAEATPAWKQWIPYCVLRCRGGVFAVRRTKGQSEARLHGAWSIGIGGHIEPVDASAATGDGAAFFRGALLRELAEELDLQHIALPEPRFLGVLNDDSTEVGAVHAGLVFAIDVPLAVPAAREHLRIGEISKMVGGFTHLVEFHELWQNPSQFESWTQMLVREGIAGPIGGSRGAAQALQDG